MGNLSIYSTDSLEILRTIIVSVVASTSIAWWIWVVNSTLGQLQSNQISFVELVFECFRALATILTILTVIAFI
ncbi:MAG: hypothetical protein OXI60_09455 [Acidiferrobacterales bacterium]|nr:hypothetical protein [Acidiferrobacterales bacterium]